MEEADAVVVEMQLVVAQGLEVGVPTTVRVLLEFTAACRGLQEHNNIQKQTSSELSKTQI